VLFWHQLNNSILKAIYLTLKRRSTVDLYEQILHGYNFFHHIDIGCICLDAVSADDRVHQIFLGFGKFSEYFASIAHRLGFFQCQVEVIDVVLDFTDIDAIITPIDQ
jgi:hypothetical protein